VPGQQAARMSLQVTMFETLAYQVNAIGQAFNVYYTLSIRSHDGHIHELGTVTLDKASAAPELNFICALNQSTGSNEIPVCPENLILHLVVRKPAEDSV